MKLLELSFSDLPLTKEDLLLLASSEALSHLRNISLKQIEALDDEAFSLILSATKFNLSGIHIHNSINLTDDSLPCIRRCNGQRNLKSLQLSGVKNLTSAGLETFFTSNIPNLPDPPALRMLDLSACNDASVNDIVMGLAIDSASLLGGTAARENITTGGIQVLNISSSSITDNTLEKLAAECPTSLQELNVSFSPNVSDNGLGYLVSKIDD